MLQHPEHSCLLHNVVYILSNLGQVNTAVLQYFWDYLSDRTHHVQLNATINILHRCMVVKGESRRAVLYIGPCTIAVLNLHEYVAIQLQDQWAGLLLQYTDTTFVY